MADFEYLDVNAQDLAEALEGRSDEAAWLLDLETGELVLVSDDIRADEEEESFENPERYLPISAMRPSESFQLMKDFVADIPNGIPRNTLGTALEHRNPFRSFKDTLFDFPALREAWFKYHDGRMLICAQEWLEENLPGARLSQE